MSGSPRVFIFSDDTADQEYRHTVKASWMQDGRMVTKEREVKVMGGEKAVVDFTKEKMPEPARSEDGKVPPLPREENP